MTSSGEPSQALARRLRSLRVDGLAGHTITQTDLANAFSRRKRVGISSISSWENPTKPAVPPLDRLEAYATFFATERSVAAQPFRLLNPTDLTHQEQARRDALLQELTELRNDALAPPRGQATQASATSGDFWRFPPDQNITIVCAELPAELRSKIPNSDPASLDYVQAYRYSDLDALLLAYGHIRAHNPLNHVNITTPSEANVDYTANLFVIGGVDWNALTRVLEDRIESLPIRQIKRELEGDVGGFEAGEDVQLFKPKLHEDGAILEDVAHFYRGPNPFNRERSATIFNGMFGRGTVGVVRALTDPRFMDRNGQFVKDHLGRKGELSIISTVAVVGGESVPPDWTKPGTTLHVWPSEPDGHR